MQDLFSEYDINNIIIENCYFDNLVAGVEGASSPDWIRGNGAIRNVIIRNCRINAGQFTAIDIKCKIKISSKFYDKQDRAGGITIDNCIINSSANASMDIFTP